jgi:predicted CXXCH cytochrome family protein
MNRKQKNILIILILFTLPLIPFSVYSRTSISTAHGDRSKLPNGCASCHRGHGAHNTPMLPQDESVFCFRCHGSGTNVARARRRRDISEDAKVVDLQREFAKTYHHPVEIEDNKYGINDKSSAQNDASAPRRVKCADCHNTHYVTGNNTMAGIQGVNMQGAKVGNVTYEYELCFKCHAYSANLPSDQVNKADLFRITNPSYHPVIAAGKNSNVPSLVAPLTIQSIIKCTDCHNNDNPAGPKGPHGSIYRHILKKNFSDTDGPESPAQYALCYSCHRRASILSNASFKYHSQHILVVGTSCRTCHNPHGSMYNAHLIDFDNNPAIMPSSSGRLEYRYLGVKKGECYLNCHGRDHNPESYQTSTGS